ncbi:MAG: LiaF transmembrane domain-containing protein [Clostridia bacterium]
MGERSGKILLGLVLLIVGIMLVFDQLGIHMGTIMRMLIPGLLMVYGAKKIISAEPARSKGWGIFVFLFGLLMLIGKLELLFSSLLAVILLYAGFRLLRSRPQHESVSMAERHWAQAVLKEDAFDRFEQEWKEKKQ